MTKVRFDGFITDVQRVLYLEDNKFTLKNDKGEDENHSGAWILVDGGYLNWSTLICPFKDSISVKEQRWSRWAESMRKDVECTFGILKGIMIYLYAIYLICIFHYINHISFYYREMENTKIRNQGAWYRTSG